MDGSVGWCDAIEIVPTQLKDRYGDAELGVEVYPAMKKWVEYLIRLAKKAAEKTEKECRRSCNGTLSITVSCGASGWSLTRIAPVI